MDKSLHEDVPAFDSPERESFRDNDLLARIGEDAYAQIECEIDVAHYRPREVIFEEDDLGDSLFLIAQGSVKISKRGRAGQQETLTHLMEGDFFGEMALVDTGRRSAQATAVGHTIVGRVDSETWDHLLRLAPHAVMSNFMRAVTTRLRQNNQHFIEEMMRTERLSLLGTTISSIVHDLNNPIASILGACEAIQSTSHDPLTAKMTRIIRDSVDKMHTMTQELIDFSRGNTNLKLRTISVNELLEALAPDFTGGEPQIEIEIAQSYGGEFIADRHRLLRVFGNLIQNARESMKRSAHKHLRFAIARVDDKVRFEISDTGCGISRDLLPRIFEPFFTHGKSNGTGLGLAISKAVVEAHKGAISVSSSEEGTVFQVDLPLGI